MTTPQSRCLLCYRLGHAIKDCNDERILYTWNKALRIRIQQLIHYPRENEGWVHDADLEEVRRFLETIPWSLLWAVGVRYANLSIIREARGIIPQMANYIRREIIRFTQSSPDERRAYMIRIGYTFTEDGLHYYSEENSYPSPNEMKESHPIDFTHVCIETEEELAAEVECAICYENRIIRNMDTLNCSHMFCHGCVRRQLETLQSCALCRVPITSITIRDNANYIDIIRS
jgi:hypothetical protein